MRRLLVGLIDAQVEGVQVVPDEFSIEGVGFAGEDVEYACSDWRPLRHWLLKRTTSHLSQLSLDIIHALDGSIHQPASKIAQKLHLPLVVSLWSKDEVDAFRLRKIATQVITTVPTEPLAKYARQHLPTGVSVELVRPGVWGTDPENKPLADPDKSLCCLVIVENAVRDHGWRNLLTAAAKLKDRMSELMLFIYGPEQDQHVVWHAAHELNLLNHICMVDWGPESIVPVVQADVLLLPQTATVTRTLVLELMASTRPVISVSSPMLDFLVPDETAFILSESTEENWINSLTKLTDFPDIMIRIGESARRFVRKHHSAYGFAESVVGVYGKLVDPPPLPFGI